MALFFGAGTLYNRDNHEYLVKAFPVNIRFTAIGSSHLLLPHAFFASARIELAGAGQRVPGVAWQLRTVPFPGPLTGLATSMPPIAIILNPTPGKDLVLLDTRDAENRANGRAASWALRSFSLTERT